MHSNQSSARKVRIDRVPYVRFTFRKYRMYEFWKKVFHILKAHSIFLPYGFSQCAGKNIVRSAGAGNVHGNLGKILNKFFVRYSIRHWKLSNRKYVLSGHIQSASFSVALYIFLNKLRTALSYHKAYFYNTNIPRIHPNFLWDLNCLGANVKYCRLANSR